MTSFGGPLINRVLTVDDNPDIHEDFKKILNRESSAVRHSPRKRRYCWVTRSRRTRTRALSSTVRFRVRRVWSSLDRHGPRAALCRGLH